MNRDVSGEARIPAGNEHGGEWTTGSAPSRSERAKASYNPTNRSKHEVARKAELFIANMLGGNHITGNKPMDVILVHPNGKTYGIEVKAVIKNKNEKLTMHPESLDRKVAWGRKHHASVHTVVVDMQSRQILYRRGVGSFEFGTMDRIESPKHLMKLIGI